MTSTETETKSVSVEDKVDIEGNDDGVGVKEENGSFSLDDKGRKVYNITDDGLVKKIMIKSNDSGEKVSDHILGRVWINIKGETADGIVFIDELFEEIDLCLGKAEHSKGIDQALVTMKYAEHAIIEIYDIEKYGYPKGKIPSKCPLTNENKEQFPLRYNLIVIDSLPKQEQSHDMTFKEQLNTANMLRERGNKRYEKERFKTALNIYNRAIQCLDAMKDIDISMPEELEKQTKIDKQSITELLLKCYLNCSICHRRLKEHDECIKFATKALEIDNKCWKGFIRRGLSYYDKGNYDLAKKDIIIFLKIANDDKQKKLANKYLNKIQIAKQKEANKQKEIYGGFLNKKSKKNVSLYDDKKITKNEDDDDGFFWKLITAIPNAIIYSINQCTKYCRKKNKYQ